MNGQRVFWAALFVVAASFSNSQANNDVKGAGGGGDDAVSVGGGGSSSNSVNASNVVDLNRLAEPNYLSTYLTTVQAVKGATGQAFRANLNGIWAGFWQHRDTPVNWSGYDAFKITLQNLTARTTEFTFKIDGAPLNTDHSKVDAVTFFLPANATVTYVVDINGEMAKQHGFRAMPPAIEGKQVRLFMGKKMNLPTIYRWSLYQREAVSTALIVSDIQLLSTNRTAVGIIDAFGQYSGGQWLGKAHGVSDLSNQLSDEQIDLANNPGPGNLTGSMTQPPLLGASKMWRTAKTGSGKWYLVHPSGRRFWSFGITCINWQNETAVTGRDYMFTNLPPKDATYGQFYGVKNGKETFDFVSANLFRKYGSDYKTDFVLQATSRLKSWGMNTAGAWSGPMESQSQIPYTLTRNTNGFTRRLATPLAYWNTLPDAFDATFQTWMTTLFKKELIGHNGKANFMGIFVDNELSWGLMDTPAQRFQIGVAALKAPMTQPAKAEFIKQLKAKYKLIGTLNKAWGTTYSAWTVLEAANGYSESVMNTKVQEDMRLFVISFAKAYYGKVKAALTASGLTGLYLGAREAWPTPESAFGAMSFVDVYSVNAYRFADRVDWTFPESTKPVFIGEFSFGSNDRGGFNPGTFCVVDQAARAAMLKQYTEAALKSPKVVGVNWFQYYDQPVSGRAQDGESYAIGVVSITDKPYSEFVEAARAIGQSMYQLRGL